MISAAPIMLSLRMPCSCMSRVYSCVGCWKSRSIRPASAACWPRHSRRGLERAGPRRSSMRPGTSPTGRKRIYVASSWPLAGPASCATSIMRRNLSYLPPRNTISAMLIQSPGLLSVQPQHLTAGSTPRRHPSKDCETAPRNNASCAEGSISRLPSSPISPRPRRRRGTRH